jgi:hypothetical protein
MAESPTPPRRANPLWYLLVTAAVVWALWAFVFAPALRATRAPSAPAQAATRAVTYQVTGAGARQASLTYTNKTGDTEQKADARLPWSIIIDVKPGAFAYVSAQNAGASGAVTCVILVDGVEVSRATGDGGYQIAGCKASVK